MSNAVLKGNASGTGTVTIETPNTNSDRTITLPDGTGTAVVNGVNSSIVSGTSVASTSGTSIDFTGIPSWVKRITVMLQGVSTNGTSNYLIQIGTSSGVTTSGYLGGFSNTASGFNSTAGFGIVAGAGSVVMHGSMQINNITGNSWVASHSMGRSDAASISVGGGSVALSGTLDRVRITTVNGTDTFDAGTINILYE